MRPSCCQPRPQTRSRPLSRSGTQVSKHPHPRPRPRPRPRPSYPPPPTAIIDQPASLLTTRLLKTTGSPLPTSLLAQARSTVTPSTISARMACSSRRFTIHIRRSMFLRLQTSWRQRCEKSERLVCCGSSLGRSKKTRAELNDLNRVCDGENLELNCNRKRCSLGERGGGITKYMNHTPLMRKQKDILIDLIIGPSPSGMNAQPNRA